MNNILISVKFIAPIEKVACFFYFNFPPLNPGLAWLRVLSYSNCRPGINDVCWPRYTSDSVFNKMSIYSCRNLDRTKTNFHN